MAERKAFLLRLPKNLYEELARWAKDDLRSTNAHIEWLLRESVRKRRKADLSRSERDSDSEDDSAEGNTSAR